MQQQVGAWRLRNCLCAHLHNLHRRRHRHLLHRPSPHNHRNHRLRHLPHHCHRLRRHRKPAASFHISQTCETTIRPSGATQTRNAGPMLHFVSHTSTPAMMGNSRAASTMQQTACASWHLNRTCVSMFHPRRLRHRCPLCHHLHCLPRPPRRPRLLHPLRRLRRSLHCHHLAHRHLRQTLASSSCLSQTFGAAARPSMPH